MAIQLDFPSPIGITANFWQINEIRLGFQSFQAAVVVGIYLSQDTAMDEPVSIQEYILDISNFDWSQPIQNDLTDLFYPMLLQLPGFEQAQNVSNVIRPLPPIPLPPSNT